MTGVGEQKTEDFEGGSRKSECGGRKRELGGWKVAKEVGRRQMTRLRLMASPRHAEDR